MICTYQSANGTAEAGALATETERMHITCGNGPISALYIEVFS